VGRVRAAFRIRWFRRTVLLGVAALVVLALLSTISVLSMRGHLEDGKTELDQAQSLLVAGKLDAAAAAFHRAGSDFDRAGGAPGAFAVRADALLPLIGRTPDALMSLIGLGRDVSSAGEGLSREVARLPGGLAALGPKDGRIPVDTLSALAPAMHRARMLLDRAQRTADRLPGSWVVGPVAGARDTLRAKLAQAVPLVRAADALAHQLPAFAGATGPVRYFVGAQNLAEARGTGGLIGNFAILTIDHGVMSFGPFDDVSSLDNVPVSEAPAPNPVYDAWGGGGFWLNLNMTPDAPTAAGMIESLYQRVRGQQLDGTILVDLQAMADMLDVTGPVAVPRLHATLTADNVVRFVADARYLALKHDPYALGPRLVSEAVLERFFGGASPDEAVRALVSAAAGGHIVLHSAHPDVQAALREAGVSGAFGRPTADGDFFSVVTDNASPNKVDFYVHRSIRYAVTLERGGASRANVSVGFRNAAPTGRSSYSLGSKARYGLQPGELRSWTSLYCPADCRPEAATEAGQPTSLPYYHDLGMSMLGRFVTVKAQQTNTIGVTLRRPRGWDGDVAAGVYRLRLQGQPSIQPTSVTVIVRAPPGMHITWTSRPMRVAGATATWTGTMGPRSDFEIRFSKSFVGGAWSRVVHFLSSPAVHL